MFIAGYKRARPSEMDMKFHREFQPWLQKNLKFKQLILGQVSLGYILMMRKKQIITIIKNYKKMKIII